MIKRIKRGNVCAEALAEQSYGYRLGYLWLNIAMMEDRRNTPINPLRWSVVDALWVLFMCVYLSWYVLFKVGATPWEALMLGRAIPIQFFDDEGAPTDYSYLDVWYYDNGKIER